MKTRNKWTALILSGALALSLLAGCAGTPASDETPANASTPTATSEGSQREPQREPEVEPEPKTSPDAEPETSPDAETETESKSGGVLVVYYSATGSTEAVAGYIAKAANADTFAITPAEPYTSDDLNWRDNSSRVTREHDDASLRVMELAEMTIEGWENYDTVFIGYPIWWGIAAWPVDNFISANDFTGKTVIPFCTSSSSGLGESGELLAELAGTGNWLEGQRFQSRVSEEDVRAWLESLDF